MIREIENAINSKKRLQELNQAIAVAETCRNEFFPRYEEPLKTLYHTLSEKDCALVHQMGEETWLIRSKFWDDYEEAPIWLEKVQKASAVAFDE